MASIAGTLKQIVGGGGKSDLLNAAVGAGIGVAASVMTDGAIPPDFAVLAGGGAGLMSNKLKSAGREMSSGFFSSSQSAGADAIITAQQLDRQNQVEAGLQVDPDARALGSKEAEIKNVQPETTTNLDVIATRGLDGRDGTEVGNGRAQQGVNGAIIAGVQQEGYAAAPDRSGLDQSNKDAARKEAQLGMKELTPEQLHHQQLQQQQALQQDAGLRSAAETAAIGNSVAGQQDMANSKNLELGNNKQQNVVGGDQQGINSPTQIHAQGQGNTALERAEAVANNPETKAAAEAFKSTGSSPAMQADGYGASLGASALGQSVGGGAPGGGGPGGGGPGG